MGDGGNSDTDTAYGGFRERLQARRQELQALSETTKSERGPVTLDQQSVGRLSRMDALQVQAMNVETERRRTAELTRIDAALKRLETDGFGYCIICDEAIAEKRLNHDPAVATCIRCAARGE